MKMHRPDAYPEILCNFFVVATLRQTMHHFILPLRQSHIFASAFASSPITLRVSTVFEFVHLSACKLLVEADRRRRSRLRSGHLEPSDAGPSVHRGSNFDDPPLGKMRSSGPASTSVPGSSFSGACRQCILATGRERQPV